jgi:Zn-dependent peptidase ImmA (M78 family)/DNA-binding XRE family transcriptional regulator
LARKRRGLSQLKLASAIDVDARSITAYENGEFPPSPETLGELAAALSFPEEFFSGDDLDEINADTPSFRASTKMRAPQRDMALSQGAIALAFNDWVEAHFEMPAPDIPDLGREPDPEAAAVSLRMAWGIGLLPVRNMIHLLEAKGVRVFSLSVAAKEVDAFSLWKGNVPFVFLNTFKTSEHSRFDAAHELGHLALHKHGSPQGREAEKEANAFASAFLMPRGAVLAQSPAFPVYSELAKRKKAFNVSLAAYAYRLHALGLMSDWQYRGICVEISKRGRDFEPESAARETSLVLPKILAALHEEGITRAQIAKTLNIDLSELEQLLFGLALAGIKGGRRDAPPRSAAALRRIK